MNDNNRIHPPSKRAFGGRTLKDNMSRDKALRSYKGRVQPAFVSSTKYSLSQNSYLSLLLKRNYIPHDEAVFRLPTRTKSKLINLLKSKRLEEVMQKVPRIR